MPSLVESGTVNVEYGLWRICKPGGLKLCRSYSSLRIVVQYLRGFDELVGRYLTALARLQGQHRAASGQHVGSAN